jgi:hypothetical protein
LKFSYLKLKIDKKAEENDWKKMESDLLLKMNKNLNLNAQLNYIKWLNGQFNYKFNAYYSSCLEKAHLTYEIHKATQSSQFRPFGHLSCLEFYLLNNPDKIEKVL